MRKGLSIFLFFILILSLGGPVLAHDGWSQTNRPIIEPGEVAYVELLYGNHSNEHASYRIEGTWNPDDTDVFVTSPTGEQVNISDTIFYTGEQSETGESQAGASNYHIASFAAVDPGIYVISVERDSIFTHGEVSSRTLRSAKSFVAVSEIPLRSHVLEFAGYDQQVTPDRAELIPLFNPVAITPDQEVSVQLIKQGEPLADTEVTLIRRSTSDSERYVTDAEGIVNFRTGPADYYLVRAKPSTDEMVEGEYDQTNYEATLTFTVQNGSGLSLQEAYTFLNQNLAANDRTNEETNALQTQANLFLNPFFYLSLLLGLGLFVTLISLLRRKA